MQNTIVGILSLFMCLWITPGCFDGVTPEDTSADADATLSQGPGSSGNLPPGFGEETGGDAASVDSPDISTEADSVEQYIPDTTAEPDTTVEPDTAIDPCLADDECNPECDEDPDCPPPPNPCLEDGFCNQTDCNVGEDPDCDTGGPKCVEDGVCDPECWDTDPDCGCEALGIGSDWSGTFEGEIPYQFTLGFGDGTEDVEGNISFQIDCLASKYIVQGEMSGAEESGVPFSVTLSGSYNPNTETLTAQMLDGVVMLLPGIAEITFEGVFEGVLIFGDHFEGTWSGQSTGGAGGILEATGSGTWTAYSQ